MSDTTTKRFNIGGEVVVPGHEKTITTLKKIVAVYRAAGFDPNGKYNFDQKRQDAAIGEIMKLSQFYTASDALQFLGKAVSSPPRPTPPTKQLRSSPKPP